MEEESLKKALAQINCLTAKAQSVEPEYTYVNKHTHLENSLSNIDKEAPTSRKKNRFSRSASKLLGIEADTKKDFGLNLTSSNWDFVAPKKQYEMLRAVSSNQVEQLKLLLEHGAALRGMPVYSIDFGKCMMSQGNAFIRGKVCFQNDSYTRTLPSWYQGSAIYLLENLAPILNDEVLISNFFKDLSAINNERISNGDVNDCFIIKEQLSLVLLCTPDELTMLTRIYNKLQFGFNLISVIKMKV
ncbi:hypothetical protein [Pseudoalteromonas distincta]|uniref:hypothetical protein n=1 Tax=Pseudoalteromonas distincta TaxID=77608 RepID=UPI00186A6B4D|nr:hypothetical protein [Pseudoalteromonas distincta]MBE3674881.1 hypothetical protein [Pseudoalteromonas distincta KMM 3548]